MVILRDVIADYEAEFGEISDDEIDRQRRSDRQNAVVVRGGPRQALLAADGDEIVTLDSDDIERLAVRAGRHVELIRP